MRRPPVTSAAQDAKLRPATGPATKPFFSPSSSRLIWEPQIVYGVRVSTFIFHLSCALAGFALAVTVSHAAELETVAGGLVSTNRYERVATVTGGSAFKLASAWKEDDDFFVEVSAAFKSSQTGGGSVWLRLDGVAEEGRPFALFWDGASGAFQLAGDLPREFASASEAPEFREARMRLVIGKPNAPGMQRARIDVLENGRWEAALAMPVVSLPGLRSWVEEGGAVQAGVADAEIAGLDVKVQRPPTLFIVK